MNIDLGMCMTESIRRNFHVSCTKTKY